MRRRNGECWRFCLGRCDVNADPFRTIIERLNHVRKRPNMYVYPLDVDNVVSWLNGFQIYESLIHDKADREFWFNFRRQAIEGIGLPFDARGPAAEMQNLGWTPEKTIDGLLLIELNVVEAARTALNSENP